MAESGAQAQLVMVVWPAMIGFGNPGPIILPPERRGQIFWRPETIDGNATIVGSAKVWVPKGEYTRLEYFRDPEGILCGTAPFPHPFIQPADDWVVVDPIVNNDPINVDMGGIAR
jgi:hypothetical protein